MIPESIVRKEQDSHSGIRSQSESVKVTITRIMQDLELGSCNACSKTTRYLADYGTGGDDSTSKTQNLFIKQAPLVENHSFR